MSGGSFNYMYGQIEDTYVGEMEDRELNEMIKDLCYVLHALEWWKSADYAEDSYRKKVATFKAKWFGSRDDRLKSIIEEVCNDAKQELFNICGFNYTEAIANQTEITQIEKS